MGQNPKRTIRARCHDMLVAIDAVANMIDDQDLAAYRSNIALRFAVERAVEIVSEASRHIPEDIRAAYPAVPWPEIAAIGNRLRHEYQRVDDTIMWGIATRSLPELRPVIHQIASRV